MAPDLTLKTFSTAELCTLIPGLTARRLQWLDEQNVIPADRAGWARQYRIEDALAVAIVADLRSKGLSLQRIRAVIRRLQFEIDRRILPLIARGKQSYIVTDGKSVMVETDPARLLDRLSTTTLNCYVVDVAHQIEILNPEPKKALRAAT